MSNQSANEMVGISIVEAQEGRSRVLMSDPAAIAEPSGEVAFGALVMLMDCAMGNAVSGLSRGGHQFAPAIEIKVNVWGAPVGVMEAEGKVILFAPPMTVAQAQIRDGSGKLIASAQGTFLMPNR